MQIPPLLKSWPWSPSEEARKQGCRWGWEVWVGEEVVQMKIMWKKSNIIIIIHYQGWTSPLSRSRPSGTPDRQGGQTRLWMLKENIYWLPANIFLVLKTGRSNWTNQPPIWLLGFRIVEIQEKYSAVEDQTACCYMFVEGNPAPTFKFYKVTFFDKERHFWATIYLDIFEPTFIFKIRNCCRQ